MRFPKPLAGMLLALSAGCGASGVHFDGTAQRRLLEPRDIAFADTAPPRHERLGRVRAECSSMDPLTQSDRELSEARLSDLSCSRELLVAALRDRAAEVGGTLLVETRCEGDGDPSCRAEVWTPAASAPRPVASERPVNEDPKAAAAPGAPPRGHTADAWRIVVSSWSSRPHSVEPRDPEHVEVLSVPRIGQVVLADLKAHCSGGCATESVRVALRTGAARLGGSSVAGERCIQEGGATTCVGSALAPEVDEQKLRAEVP